MKTLRRSKPIDSKQAKDGGKSTGSQSNLSGNAANTAAAGSQGASGSSGGHSGASANSNASTGGASAGAAGGSGGGSSPGTGQGTTGAAGSEGSGGAGGGLVSGIAAGGGAGGAANAALIGNQFGAQGDMGNSEWLPSRKLIRPPGQLSLTDSQLDEEITRILNANNPHAPQNIARWNFKEQVYKATPIVDHLVTHIEFEGYLAFKGEEKKGFGIEDSNKTQQETQSSTNSLAPLESPSSLQSPDAEEQHGDKTAWPPARNQFNYSERATQPISFGLRSRCSNTEPPPHRTFSGSVNQWVIYDAYMEDTMAKEKMAREKNRNLSSKAHKEEEKKITLSSEASSHGDDLLHSLEFQKRLTILERMANQNTFAEQAHDFKYWDDMADELLEHKQGSLLPLWNFVYTKEKKKQVTALAWNPRYSDLFAVAYGSYRFTKQGPGVVCCFSLKNPSFPEFIVPTSCGVMAIDFHPRRPHLLAMGLYDGSCMVLDFSAGFGLGLGSAAGGTGAGPGGSAGGGGGVTSQASGSSVGAAGGGGSSSGASGASGASSGGSGGGGSSGGGSGAGHASLGAGGGGLSSAGSGGMNGVNASSTVYGSGCAYLRNVSDMRQQHHGVVWQVAWQPDDLDGNMNFYSVSSDGTVKQAVLMKTEMIMRNVISLRSTPAASGAASKSLQNGAKAAGSIPPTPQQSPSKVQQAAPGALSHPASSAESASLDASVCAAGSGKSGVAPQALIPESPENFVATRNKALLLSELSGLCFDFNRQNDNIFTVGTEEGYLIKCSKDYKSQYLEIFEAHCMPIYRVLYNPYFPVVYLTASADWTVRLFDQRSQKPVLIFDFGCPVADIAWAPHSSTVFGVATSGGLVEIYDLEVSKFDPVCSQRIVARAKLTKLSFNPFEPVLIVADDNGQVYCLKLSPNLRKVGRLSGASGSGGGGSAGAGATGGSGGNAATRLSLEDQRERIEKITLSAMGKMGK